MKPWIQTFTGRRIIVEEPKPSDIDIIDIAEGLSKQCRYTGQTLSFCSVAQHSVEVSMLVEQEATRLMDHTAAVRNAAMIGLFHDGHEAYLGDMTAPVERALPHAMRMWWHCLKVKYDVAIFGRFGILPNPAAERLVKHADMVLLATECRDFMGGQRAGKWGDMPPPLEAKAILMEHETAKGWFMSRFRALMDFRA